MAIALFILMAAFVALVIFLPLLSGMFTYKPNPSYLEKRKEKESEKLKSQNDDGYGGYVPPDEQLELEKQAKSSGSRIYSKISHLTQDDIPIKLQLQSHGELKNRTARKPVTTDSNPNSFDYDLNELIDEDFESERAENSKVYAPGIISNHEEV
ncbi:hypothetical protein KL930_000345 [Ogataea haglerorum]|uniref:Uncharacterized protein n=1 Tax=Ogataea haglerorum TaxID=1937702 RepID=A0AAN6D4R8_9ASCO|nr:uncharacterized protein KL911_000786 [Ogataea haglerorum]KAG7697600.1 hypothetical protein KL951_002174 [Ogataea haglerorum]KAG7701201.1 hypothetical protein KL915_000232 [Ogataea haglerorum]KAG7705892.1 hypothetical protein KL950_003468 [Ogataea haglerorum]KAG7709159.1 hypothetical protein KL914_001549 [Ogataea haglerorum]KAG7715287.1 hypothetical protein KL913_004119 [Ogataea haglerorum]